MMFRRPLKISAEAGMFLTLSIQFIKLQESRTQICFRFMCSANRFFNCDRDFKAEILSSQPFIDVCQPVTLTVFYVDFITQLSHSPNVCSNVDFHSLQKIIKLPCQCAGKHLQHGQEKVKCLPWFHPECFEWSNDLRIACVNVDVRGVSSWFEIRLFALWICKSAIFMFVKLGFANVVLN